MDSVKLNMNSIESVELPLVLRKSKKYSFRKFKTPLSRLVTKSGTSTIQFRQLPYQKYLSYSKDFANTLISIRWRWVTLFVILINTVFYIFFSGVWMLDAYISGDFDPTKTENFCIKHSRTYTGYLLLSIETITTTGYGYLHPTENCTIVWLTMLLCTLVMIVLDGAFISMVYLKICKPEKRDALVLISKKAVICLRNGKMSLVIRIFDHLDKHVINPTVNLYYINKNQIDNKISVIQLQEMNITSTGTFLWPTDVVHEINKDSPLYTLEATDVLKCKFEIVLSLSGISLVTGQTSISKTSYLNEEILWGYRFKNCIDFEEKQKTYKINESYLFKVAPCDTPLCSAKILEGIQNEVAAFSPSYILD